MHFVGPDQLHGFEERLTTDVYPGDFGWTPDWSRPRRAGRLVVPQHELGQGGGGGRDHEPARVRRRGRVPRRPPPLRLRALRGRRAAHAVRLLHPSARPVRRAAALLGPVRGRRTSTCRLRRRCRTRSWTRTAGGSGTTARWATLEITEDGRPRGRATATTRASRTSTSGSARCSTRSRRAGSPTTRS